MAGWCTGGAYGLSTERDKLPYDCRPYLMGNNETCTFSSSTAGTYHIKVRDYAAATGVSLVGALSP